MFLSDGTSALHYEPHTPKRRQVLLTHGLTACAANLDTLSAYLAGHGYRTLALDLPGHVLGSTGGTLVSVEMALAALRAGVERLRATGEVALVGHSFGAACSALSASGPGVAGLCVVAAGALASRRFTGPVGKPMRDQRASYVVGMALEALLDETHTRLADTLGALSGVPVLAIGALQDAIVSRADMELWLQRVPHSALEWVDASHMDAPVAARGMIGRWLDELPGPV